ncbi:hypothetical protein ZIOFF_002719 [Zingiber officinale]|uniref:Interactor of constitutive active ROPs 4 n=1 Tax=Zingiber officinale TaxID=94328 RepID=A0A8J5I7D0_ZINOF|nr:hypothetical protein ZIOFF_002719 [Zingiber officinale]
MLNGDSKSILVSDNQATTLTQSEDYLQPLKSVVTLLSSSLQLFNLTVDHPRNGQVETTAWEEGGSLKSWGRCDARVQVRTFFEHLVCCVAVSCCGVERGSDLGVLIMGSRGSSDAPQRQSPRAPLHLRSTACSEANNAHRRAAAADGSPKVSPHGGSQEQRKRSTRAAELETKLRETQAELKKLREQLAAAEAAKREVERALVKVKVRVPAAALAKKRKEEEAALSQGSRPEGVRQNETMEESVTSPATMDVFEVLVPAESVPTEDEADSMQEITMVEKTETNENDETISAAGEEEEEGEKKEDGKKREDEEVGFWKAKLLEKEKEVAILLEENVIFKTRAEEEAQRIAESSRSKQEEFTARLNSVEEQLKESKTNEKQLAAQLETAEGAKATLEMELKRLKVQTEQWRKAAEAAAAALATGDAASGDETGGRRVAERCRSMDKQHLGVGYGSWASPLADQDYVYEEDGAGGSRGGRRKAAGVRMFGNLWKKNQYK